MKRIDYVLYIYLLVIVYFADFIFNFCFVETLGICSLIILIFCLCFDCLRKM